MVTVVLTAAAAVLLVAIIVHTLTQLEPLNRGADGWDPARLPETWELDRARWQWWHLARTVLAVVAFGLLLVAQALARDAA